MAGFQVRQADDSDRAAIIRLVSQMWGRDVSAHYQWLYRANPHGRALTWLAFDQATGEAVGCMSLFPRRLWVEGRERLGAQRGDVFVVPAWRGRGLARALIALSHADIGAAGVAVIFGTTTPQVMPVFDGAGVVSVSAVELWARPLAASGAAAGSPWQPRPRAAALLLRLAERAGPLVRLLDSATRAPTRGLTLERTDAFGPEFDGLFERARSQYRVVGVRDRQYLGWRYLDAPGRAQRPFAIRWGGRLVGWLALETVGRRARLVDLFAPTEPVLLDAGVQLAVDRAARAGCTSMEVWCSLGSALARRLPRRGFVRLHADPFGVYVDTDAQAAVLRDSRAWFFTLGDHDADALSAD